MTTTDNQFLTLLAEQVAEETIKRLTEKMKGFQNEPLLYSMEQAAKKLGLSLTTFKEMVAEREITTVKRGTRRLITRRALDTWIDRNEG